MPETKLFSKIVRVILKPNPNPSWDGKTTKQQQNKMEKKKNKLRSWVRLVMFYFAENKIQSFTNNSRLW